MGLRESGAFLVLCGRECEMVNHVKEILGKSLSTKGVKFINELIGQIKNKVVFSSMDELKIKNFGAINCNNKCKVYLSIALEGDVFDCNVCHELLHALQIQNGFPRTEKYCDDRGDIKSRISEHIGNLPLDLDVYDTLSKKGFDNQYFFNRRKDVLNKLCKRNFDIVTTKNHRILLALGLALVLCSSEENSIGITQSFRNNQAGDIVDNAVQIKRILNERGYNSPREAFLSIGYINSYLKQWGICYVNFGDKLFKCHRDFLDYVNKEQ